MTAYNNGLAPRGERGPLARGQLWPAELAYSSLVTSVKVVGSTTPYTESSQMVPGGSGSAGFPITYEAVDPVTYNYSAYAVTFDWTNSGSGAGFNTASKSYLVVEGINFNQTGGFSANSSLIAGGYMTGVVIQSCTFTSDSWNWHCVDLPGCNYCTFENNVVGPIDRIATLPVYHLPGVASETRSTTTPLTAAAIPVLMPKRP